MQQTAFRKAPPAVSGPAEIAGGLAGSLSKMLIALGDRLIAWQSHSEQRAHLRQLSDHQLRDVGLTRAEVEEIARKTLWSRRG